MKFKIKLERTTERMVIPINYQYELSSWIYKVIRNADAQYSLFLHEKGYQTKRKTFKLFSFSNLTIPQRNIKKDRIEIISKDADFQISFYMDKTAENFIMGLFKNQLFNLGDTISNVPLSVKQVEAVAMPTFGESVILKPTSPLVIGKKNEKGHDDYLAPDHPDFADLLIRNLWDKYQATGQAIPLEWQNATISCRIIDLNRLKSRLVTIKANTPEQTKVRGYVDFSFELTAPKELIELALLAGLGKENALGFGACEVV